MMKVECQVFYEDNHWLALFQETDDQQMRVSKMIFYKELQDQKLFELITRSYQKLKFTPSVEVINKTKKINPKRMKREIMKQSLQLRTSTKAQAAFQQNYLQQKTLKKKQQKSLKKIQQDNRFALKQLKKKRKKRGK